MMEGVFRKRLYAYLMILLSSVLLLFIIEISSNIFSTNNCISRGSFFRNIDGVKEKEESFDHHLYQHNSLHMQDKTWTTSTSSSFTINDEKTMSKGSKKYTSTRFNVVATPTQITNQKVQDKTSNDVLVYESQLTRQQKFRNFCIKSKQDAQFQNKSLISPGNIFVSDKQKVLYCSVPKVACTNWKRMMLVFEGKLKQALDIQDKETVHLQRFKTFYNYNKTEQTWRENLYYSFFFVRHPFERLLSAYRNKLEDPYNGVYQRRYGREILKLFRKGLTRKQYNEGKNVTWIEFINYIIKMYDTSGISKLNEHWQVTHALCNPCKIKYNFIGKMETLNQDSQQILRELNIDENIKFPINTTDKYQVKTNILMKKYYAQLSNQTIERLYEIYQEDFEAFGYTIPTFIYI